MLMLVLGRTHYCRTAVFACAYVVMKPGFNAQQIATITAWSHQGSRDAQHSKQNHMKVLLMIKVFPCMVPLVDRMVESSSQRCN